MISLKVKETNTHPLMVHAAGKAKNNQIFQTLCQLFHAQQKSDNDGDLDVTIITWKGGGRYKNKDTILEQCVRFYKIPTIICEWPDGASFWGGCRHKITSALHVLNEGIVKTKYVMYLDIGDVLFLDHPSVILERYKDLFPGKLVWNAERNHYPKDEVINKRFPDIDKKTKARFDEVVAFDEAKTHTKFKYLNGGVAIGETQHLKEFLEYATNPENECGYHLSQPITSQFTLRIAQYHNKDRVVLDDKAELIFCPFNCVAPHLKHQELHMSDVEISYTSD